MNQPLRLAFVAIVVPVMISAASIGDHFSPPALASAKPVASVAPEPAYTYRATVVRVIDGDTVVLNIDLGFDSWLHNRHIRLLNVEAPEIRGPERPEGLKWKARLEALLPAGAEIVLLSTKDKTDKYGRYLGTLWADGVNVNEAVRMP